MDINSVNISSLKKPLMWASLGLLLIILAFKLFETNSAKEIMVIESPTGSLSVHTTAGIKWQGFGSITVYKKSFQYSFDREDEKTIQIRFNDGGHGSLSGSCRIDLPTDSKSMLILHTKFGSQDGIERNLVRTNLDKSVYFVGTLMSSKESSNSRRNDLITFISDQAEHGVYRTRQREVKALEEGMDSNKVITIVEILKDSSGRFLRQETSPFSTLSIKFSNLSINRLDYDTTVEKQIRAQQNLAMQVQTAMAEAKTAEQQVFTTMKQGEAEAAREKWKQEAIKAQAVTEAEQLLAVQRLSAEKALEYEKEQIAIGRGDGERKRLAMVANGALDQKIEAWLKSQEYWSKAFAEYKGNLVPGFIMGNSGGQQSSALDFMNLMMMKNAKDLSLDLNTR